MNEDGCSHGRDVVFRPLVPASEPPEGSFQKRNRTFDAGAELLTELELPARLPSCFPFRSAALLRRASDYLAVEPLGPLGVKSSTAGGFRVDLPCRRDESGDDALCVPEESRVGRPADVRVVSGRVDPTPLTADPLGLHGGLGQEAVDLLPGLRPAGVLQRAQGCEVQHIAVVDSDETSQEVVVVDSDDCSSRGLSLEDLAADGTRDRIRAEPALPSRAVLALAFEELLQVSVYRVNDRRSAVEDLRDPIVALVVTGW